MLDSTQLIKLADADYNMLKEKGKEGEKVLHYNGFLDGFAHGWNVARRDIEERLVAMQNSLDGSNNISNWELLDQIIKDLSKFRKRRK